MPQSSFSRCAGPGCPWDPLFGDGTRLVLRSSFSRSLPFPDAGLGLLAYLAEAALVGGGERPALA